MKKEVYVTQQKPSEVGSLRASFYAVLARWLMPLADYQLLVSIQPLADVIGDYTCHNGENKRRKNFHVTHPLPAPV